MKILIIIPTYNEIDNIRDLVKEVTAISTPHEVNILVVDDNSPDNTANAVNEMMADSAYSGSLHMLEREGKLGLGTAYIAGFKWGIENGFDVLVEMDADFSHNPDYLAPLIREVENKDFVVASRYVEGGGVKDWGLLRQFISRFGSIYARTILGVPMRDLTGGFNLWKKEVLETIGLETIQSNGYAFQVELKYRAWKNGFSFKEFPIIFVDRCKGSSKMSQGIVFEAMYRVWKIRGIK